MAKLIDAVQVSLGSTLVMHPMQLPGVTKSPFTLFSFSCCCSAFARLRSAPAKRMMPRLFILWMKYARCAGERWPHQNHGRGGSFGIARVDLDPHVGWAPLSGTPQSAAWRLARQPWHVGLQLQTTSWRSPGATMAEGRGRAAALQGVLRTGCAALHANKHTNAIKMGCQQSRGWS